MKRVIAAILAVLYLGTSSGATIHLHYCMGKLMSWALTDDGRSDCTYCGMPKAVGTGHCVAAKRGCCQDEVKKLQVDKNQRVTESAFHFLNPSFDVALANYQLLPGKRLFSIVIDYSFAHGPPDRGKVPVFLRYCNFRI
jgi:hypothetical protein